MKREIILVSAVVCIFAISILPASASPIFSEDFESYAQGSNLSGQGGWVGDAMYVNNGSYLTGSKVLDGRDDIGSNILSISRNGFGASLSSSSISTLTFDAYATSSTPLTHSTSVGLNNISGGSRVGWWAVKAQNGQFSWAFDAREIAGNSSYYQLITGGYNAPVSMSIVVDGIADEVYGIYDYGSGVVGETTHYSLTDVQIGELNAVEIYVDYRSPTTTTPSGDAYIGGEFDNIVVVPEPATMSFLLIGAIALLRKK